MKASSASDGGRDARAGRKAFKGEIGMNGDTATSTAECGQCVKGERDWDHRDCECECHERPGERERIYFHVHEFEHGCYGRHCVEAYRLYAAWQAAIASSAGVLGGVRRLRRR